MLIGGAIISIAAGFAIGKTVTADSPLPGSSADPVVSKSYVDKALQERVAGLEKTVAELTVQAQALQSTINELQAKINKSSGKTTPSTPGTTTPSETTAPGGGGGSSHVGKTAYIKPANNYVNLRSAPDINSSVLKKVLKDEPMYIFEEKDKWYHVELKDKTTGWVASWVVDVK
jgi:hypothetical protein